VRDTSVNYIAAFGRPDSGGDAFGVKAAS
jgi:hypothetical protein